MGVAAMKESMNDEELHHFAQWISGARQLADDLTKHTRCNGLLTAVTETNTWSLVETDEVREKRAAKRERLKASLRAPGASSPTGPAPVSTALAVSMLEDLRHEVLVLTEAGTYDAACAEDAATAQRARRGTAALCVSDVAACSAERRRP